MHRFIHFLSPIALVLLISHLTFSQSSSVSIGTSTTNAKAVLQLVGANKDQGFVIPIVRNKIVVGAGQSEKGMILFDESDNKVYFFDGTIWNAINGSGSLSGIDLNGNVISLSGTQTSFGLANPSPNGVTDQGRLFFWDGAKWSITPKPNTTGQILKWDNTKGSWFLDSDNSGTSSLNANQIFVGNASNVATSVSMSGDATIDNTGTITIATNAVTAAKIATNTITDAQVSVTANIDGSKIKNGSLPINKIINWPTDASGILTNNGTGNLSWSTNSGLSSTLSSTNIFVGNTSNVATGVAMSGDATINNIGALSIANGAVSGGLGGKIADATISSADIANAQITNAKLAAGAVTASNGLTSSTANNISLGGTLTANTTINMSSFDLALTNTTGKLGIGTAVPTEKLDIVGNLKFSGTLMPNNLPGTIGQVLTSAGAGAAPTWNSLATSISPANTIIKGNAAGAAQVASQIFDDGTFVGIGTTTPTGKLQIEGTDFGVSPVILSSVSTIGSTLQFTNPSAGNHIYDIVGSTGPAAGTGAGAFGIFDQTVGGYRLVITPSGNVGIGSNSPSVGLQVAGVAQTNATLSLKNTSSNDWNIVSTDGGGLNFTKANGTPTTLMTLSPLLSSINSGLLVGGNISLQGNSLFAGHADIQSGRDIDAMSVYSNTESGTVNAFSAGSNMGIFNIKGNGDIHMVSFINSLKVGINTTAPDATLSVNGTASKSGGGTWAGFSDKRVKKDIAEYKDGLSVLNKINPVKFKYNGLAGNKEDGKEYIGVIAQDIQPVAPYMVSTIKKKLNETDNEDTDLLMYDGSALTYILVNSIKEQQQIINSLQEKVKELNEKVYMLETSNAELESIKAEVAEIKKILGMEAKKDN